MIRAADLVGQFGGEDFADAWAKFRRRPEAERAAIEVAARPDEDTAPGSSPERRALRRVPGKFLDVVLGDALEPRAAVVATTGLTSGLCILLGPHDGSKSTATAAALRPGGLWVSWLELFDLWIKNRGELLRVPRLGIDEVGRQVGSIEQRAAVAEVFCALCHARSERSDLLTVANSNLTLDGLRQALIVGRREGDGRAPPRPAVERWSLLIERLKEHGRPRSLSDELAQKGAQMVGPGMVICPREGFRRSQ